MGAPWMAWLLGAALGVRHALEPDHLAAVSTLVAQQRSARHSAWLGAWWGVGHSAGLLGAGLLLGLAQTQMPPAVGTGLELLVGLMLCALGLQAMMRARAGFDGGPGVPHTHGTVVHSHPLPGSHLHTRRWSLQVRPLMVGLLHGVAGSGTLVAMVVAGLPNAAEQFVYIGFFGFGSVLGMMVVSGVAGLSMRRWWVGPPGERMQQACGALSVVVGVLWGLQAAQTLWGPGGGG